ncbi:ferrous iron transport protein A [Flavobacteriaceae bacterium]|nr:ferrous iron transport protein A [Flavobacteriaceae bacterium]
MYKTISDLKRGEIATIISYSEEEIPLKLIEMGCIVGCSVEVIQRAPLKDPIYLNINGTFLAIRDEIASKITVA